MMGQETNIFQVVAIAALWCITWKIVDWTIEKLLKTGERKGHGRKHP
jgi:hypothetical protein